MKSHPAPVTIAVAVLGLEYMDGGFQLTSTPPTLFTPAG
jgi:hypothetical protein